MTEILRENRDVRVWTNGCFDVLHVGHVKMLRYAKSIGTVLLVGLDDDEKVKRDKGETRPINNLKDRMEMVSSIEFVDAVTSFSSPEELEEKIKSFNPDYIVVGSDYKDKRVVGSQHCGEVRYFDRVGDFSTSKIIGEK